jgi:hypothetical protein
MNVVPGHPGDQSAYRSELAGRPVHYRSSGESLVFLGAGILSGGIEIGCGGLSALSKAFDSWPLELADPYFDMLSSLRLMIASSPLTWTTRHVAGHQDDDPTHPLDWCALQNIQMDNLAKVFWMQHSHSEAVFYPLSNEGFQVWLELSSHPPSVFFNHIHGKTILNWHSSHHRFPACYARRIDWDACAAALHRLPLGRCRWVSKHISGFCSVGTMLVRWQEQPTSACPRCDQLENAPHVWQCQEPAVFFVWVLLMSSFSKWLEKVHTANDIVHWIIQRLTKWRSSAPFSAAQPHMPGLLQAISAQDRFGWPSNGLEHRKPTLSGSEEGTLVNDGPPR